MTTERRYVGIDVAKATLDVCTSDGEAWQVPNADRDMDALRVAMQQIADARTGACGDVHAFDNDVWGGVASHPVDR